MQLAPSVSGGPLQTRRTVFRHPAPPHPPNHAEPEHLTSFLFASVLFNFSLFPCLLFHLPLLTFLPRASIHSVLTAPVETAETSLPGSVERSCVGVASCRWDDASSKCFLFQQPSDASRNTNNDKVPSTQSCSTHANGCLKLPCCDGLVCSSVLGGTPSCAVADPLLRECHGSTHRCDVRSHTMQCSAAQCSPPPTTPPACTCVHLPSPIAPGSAMHYLPRCWPLM